MYIDHTNKERRDKVIELYLKDLTQREIAKTLKMSLRDVSTTIKEYESKRDKVKAEKSNAAKAFQLFLDGRSLVEVAIELDIPASEVEKMHDDFVRLRYQHIIPKFYHEIKQSFPDFLRYYKIVTKLNEGEKNKVKIIIDNNYIISKQKQEIHELNLENQKALEFKVKLEMDIQRLKQEYEYYNN